MRALIILLTAAGVVFAQQKLAPPKLTPIDETGYAKLMASHKGKVLLVDFWATWCVPCRAETPAIVKMANQLAARGLDVISISTDELDKQSVALEFLRKNQVPGPRYFRKAADDDKFASYVDPNWN